jgi:lipid A disaccharide synthetase
MSRTAKPVGNTRCDSREEIQMPSQEDGMYEVPGSRLRELTERIQELEGAARELVEAIDAPNLGLAAARRQQAAVEKLRELL